MTEVVGAFPYDLANLLSGCARVVISDDAGTLPAIPVDVKDIIDPEDPYTIKTGWKDVGSTTNPAAYTRDLTTQGYDIEQVSGNIFEEVTETSRTLKVEMGEIDPQNLIVVENAPGVSTITAGSGTAGGKSIAVGSVTDLIQRRVAFLGRRNKVSGVVTESDGTTKRGRWVAFVLFLAQITADPSEIQIGKGQLASAPVSFKAYPESSQPQGKEFAKWILEDAGTIAA